MVPPLLIIVPARGGSRRLPEKNQKLLGGKSLLAHTADAISQSALKAPVLLTTDHEPIASEGKRLGWTVPFLRPPELATDDAPTIDAILHALDWYCEHQGGHDPAAVMVLQPTSPLRGGNCLVVANKLLQSRADIDSVVAMTSIELPANHAYFCGPAGLASAVSNDGRKPIYVPNGALYLARTSAVRAARSFYMPRLLPLLIDKIRSIDIDTDTDWRLAEAALVAGLPPEDAAPARPSVTRNA
jgi:CMP-N,N'-diacetyllegionaminic acid synthase